MWRMLLQNHDWRNIYMRAPDASPFSPRVGRRRLLSSCICYLIMRVLPGPRGLIGESSGER